VFCHKRKYTSLQAAAEIAVCKRLEGEFSHVADGYSKLCLPVLEQAPPLSRGD